MEDYAWYGILILLIAIGVVIGVCIWSSGHKSSPTVQATALLLAADDVETGDIVELIVVTGSTGAANSFGFTAVLGTTITTPGNSNRLYCNVSASTSIATIDVSGAVPTGLSSEFGTIDIRVLVDGNQALPGPVSFNSVAHVVGTDLASGDILSFAESRAFASSYQFVARDLPAGSHDIVVEARAVAAATGIASTSAGITAIVGDRTLVVVPASTIPQSSSSS